MKIKITKRDILFFLMGFATLLLIEIVYDWDAHVEAFKRGYNDARSEQTENSKPESLPSEAGGQD